MVAMAAVASPQIHGKPNRRFMLKTSLNSLLLIIPGTYEGAVNAPWGAWGCLKRRASLQQGQRRRRQVTHRHYPDVVQVELEDRRPPDLLVIHLALGLGAAVEQ